MTVAALKRLLIGALVSKTAVPLAALLTCCATLYLAPPGTVETAPFDPAVDANLAYGVLMARMEAAGESAPSWSADQVLRRAPGGSREPAAATARDIFSTPAKIPARPSGDAGPSAPETQPMPKLTGVFIDGDHRQAAIEGRLVSEGDRVAGFAVIEIGSSWVVLERTGVTYRLTMGNKS